MGITRNGRFAAITNYRDPSRTLPAPRSRGELPVNFLCADNSPELFLQELLPHADHYAGFNLLVGTPGNLWYFTNSLPADERAPVCLRPGIYGLSNAQLDTPWPKVVMGKQKIEALLQTARLNHPGVVAVVGDRLPADLPALHQQGLNGEMDQLLSAQFISAGTYGTRSSTSLWTDSDGLIHWCELSFDTGGQEVARTEEVFPMAAS
jgi:uncharacterized protein with NRDE domain